MHDQTFSISFQTGGDPIKAHEVGNALMRGLAELQPGRPFANLMISDDRRASAQVIRPFADQPDSSFRCPEHRTDEHASADHLMFNQGSPLVLDAAHHAKQQALQPDPHARTFGTSVPESREGKFGPVPDFPRRTGRGA